MPNFMKLMNFTWESQPLHLFASELHDLLTKKLSALFRFDRKVDDVRVYETATIPTQVYYFGDVTNKLEVRFAKKNRCTNTLLSDTTFNIQIVSPKQRTVRFSFIKDSRYEQAIIKNPLYIFEVLIDELDNYFSNLYLLKGLNKKILFNKAISNVEIMLLDNFMITGFEPVLFLFPGTICVPDTHTTFEFIMALLLSSYLFSDYTFELPHFKFKFYNDKNKGAYDVWQDTINKIVEKGAK